MTQDKARAWALAQVATMPPRWQGRLMDRWDGQRLPGADCIAQVYAERDANIELRHTVEGLEVVRLPLDASDSTICDAAAHLADRASEMARVYHTLAMVRAAMGRIALAHGAVPPIFNPGKTDHVEDGPAVARMADPLWWRRQLRGVHARKVEGAAIALGYVNKRADPYVSNESVWRRAGQNERNAATLEATTAINEDGDEFTLAELAAKGPANKAIRRAELMTRIAGFERIARDLGHAGLFFTMTCPSRMHKWRTTQAGGVIENRKYDGTLPNDAQKHLAKTWARIRAACARRGMRPYGFRIAEPNHDGTPHWHLLVFLDTRYQGGEGRDAIRRFCALVRRYALAIDGHEAGAKRHRCDFKPIDWQRGSAAGYIAKYVSKNIDGYRLDKDLLGNDAIETSHRVEAWATTWRIRQFQQVGGPPVGPWRELRRVAEMPAGTPAYMREAHAAVNKTKAIEDLSESQQQTVKGAQWDAYVKAQGGVHCGRDYRIRVAMKEREGKNKYGEPIGMVPIGVECSELETYTPAHMAWMGGKAERRVQWLVQSVRHAWEIVRTKARQLIGRVVNGPQGPWTCVNNCTRGNDDESGNAAGHHGRDGERSGGSLGESPGACQNDGGGLRWPGHEGINGHQFGT